MTSKARYFAVAVLLMLGVRVAAEGPRVDFRNDIIPVLTKAGCNAGACHGAALGRGGFKLSLYGGNPAADYLAVAQQVRGRRINLAHPDQSLIVLKPTESLEHGGGFRFDFGDESCDRLIDWIQQGAPETPTRTFERIEISPQRIVTSLDEDNPVTANAHYSDGSVQDVTRWTIFTAEDKSSVQVDESAELVVLRRGRHIVVARYLNQVVPVELIVPLNDRDVDLAQEPRINYIDEEILSALEALHLPVSPTINDPSFLRRVTLDLTGRLPSPEELQTFVEGSVDRRQVIDQLLESEEFIEYWTMQLAKLLRIGTKRRGQSEEQLRGVRTYHHWLTDQLSRDVGYDQLARDIILAAGNTHDVGPANFYRTVEGAHKQAEFTSELFMGSRLRCANCHNHPLDRWTQDDYHGLAAIFAKIEGGTIVRPKPLGEVIHPRTREPAVERIPGERFLDQDAPVDARQALVDWLVNEQNPYFAKAMVNRLWKRMMGRGLVEPTDDFRATNPATHAVLLDRLAEDFQRHDYSLRHTLRQIANSSTYARSANALPDNKDDDRFYSHALRRPLEPEVLADAVADVLALHEVYGDEPQGTRAVALINAKTASRSLDILGRCSREDSCEGAAVTTGGLPQKLHLFNGEFLNARIGHPDGRVAQLLESKQSEMEIIEQLYLRAFSRKPRDNERQHWQQRLAQLDTTDKRRAFFEDFAWGLLTSQEFVTNH